jgi:hypothetical protein
VAGLGEQRLDKVRQQSEALGNRFTHRSSMSIVLNLLRYGASSGVLRLAWSGITSSVEYTCSPCWAAMRRAMVDLPAPLPPPIQ